MKKTDRYVTQWCVEDPNDESDGRYDGAACATHEEARAMALRKSKEHGIEWASVTLETKNKLPGLWDRQWRELLGSWDEGGEPYWLPLDYDV